MNRVQAELAAYLGEILDEIGFNVIWKGGTYRAALADPSISLDLDVGGITPEGEFSIKFPRSAFKGGLGPFPAANERLEIDGEIFKVVGENNKPGSPWLTFSVAR